MIPPKPNRLPPKKLETAVPTPRRILAKAWPWLVALAILAFLFIRIPRQALWHAFGQGPWAFLGIYTAFQWLLVLLADSYATSVSFAVTGFQEPFSRIFLARGASNIVGIFNYALGQGAMGVYLQRSGVTGLRAAGNLAFLMIVNLVVLLIIASLGFFAGGSPQRAAINLAPLFYGLWVAMILYLAAVKFKPRFLQKYELLEPLWQAGLGGHLRAAAARLPHMLLLVLAYWGALRLWGIPVPLSQGLSLVPVALFINAVPITPLGLGVTQAAMVLLFSPYVPQPAPAVQAATVLALALLYYFFGLITQALLGLWCFQRMRRNH